MKSAYLLDTDWAIDFLNGRQEIVEKIRELKGYGLALSLVSLAELYEGVYYSREPEESGRKLEDFLSGVEIVALEDGVCQTFGRERGRLRQERILIGDFDLLIGATCLYHNLTLLTNNTKHFKRIHNLRTVSLPKKKKTS
ncbi:MAG TPA: type II toxin-antitoxin system VapC family toxin [Candidatus Binatia bacterium]|jgi:tRNA(fMet)-specific endonuclease VapC|nr:type II toxin-antitoxin system VapC family toxin [Candidatus Binatia bacterium]